jgi:cyclase
VLSFARHFSDSVHFETTASLTASAGGGKNVVHPLQEAQLNPQRSLMVCVFALCVTTLAFGQQNQDFSKVQIKVSKVSGSVYMLEGAGGNMAASVGEDGIVLVDDQYAPLADKIRAALKGLGVTDKPVRFVINTHYHGDHTGGNVPFSETSTVIAQDNVRQRLEAGGTSGYGDSRRREIQPAPKAALPIITFGHDLTVHLNGEEIRALHIPAGHTDGDAIVFFPKSNVVHMGDDFVRYGFPFIDIDSGGSVQGMIAGLEEVVAQLPPDVKVIPGHGALSNLNDVRDYVTMLKNTSAVVEKALQQHKTLEQMKQEKILAAWQKYSGGFINSDAFIETLYNSLTGHANHRFLRHN